MSADQAQATMPTFFIPHGGGPCFFMDWMLMGGPADTWNGLEAFLRGLQARLPHKPKGIVVISGHWEEKVFTAATTEQPAMIYDYTGFPAHTYQLRYPAPGAPALAHRIVGLLQAAGLPAATDSTRGFDHGVFVPFLLIDPAATIPVVTLSLKTDLDPEEHLAAGHALAALRDEGILIVGSGMSYHDMRGFRTPAARAPSAAFDAWLTDVVAAEPATRWQALKHWSEAPAGRASHPREEHLLPLMVAAGAGAASPGTKPFTGNVMMADISAFQFG
ncbi:aromatic ring-opening dioxygenase catalytic subunit (LigB family) [Pseudoduganella lurida]|uniref:Aromatic ring-opening dioxygenase catalytic subunit (LigB family) n=1 Tax=Pseudoduganella lurida TaxID=1036180 RepID=A0A562RDT4_9BURK|nr:class III extradiol ring-cleavage dioxygenase [Pseudoduganella lurida]TWI66566.1 aromatic ring-opening dioxygenase catalytic subunit (LigB family) [Pseudoduganella lurida]